MAPVTTLLLLALGALTSTSAEPVRHDQQHFTPDYVLVATGQNITIDCQSRYSIVINGTFPGPQLNLTEGQDAWVRVWNNIPDQNFTMHWHGLSQRMAPFSDGTPLVSQWPIAPNEYFDYHIMPEVGDAGTYFYHSHVGFQAITANGALIVKEKDAPPYQYDHDKVLMIGDYYQKTDDVIEAGLQATPFVWSGEPNAVVINGQSGTSSFTNATDATCEPYVLNVQPDCTYRLRFIGRTALSLVLMGIDGHEELDIIEADGAYTKSVTAPGYMQVATGQRFSVLFKTKSAAELLASNQTDFWIRYETRERPTVVTGYALLRYQMPSVQPKALPATLPSVSPVTLPQITYNWMEYTFEALKPKTSFPTLSQVTRTVYITVAQQPGGLNNGSIQWGMNGLPWNEASVDGSSYAPYLVNLYNGGQTPNYTAAVDGQGYDPATKAFPANVGEVLDMVWLSNNGPSGGWDYHPFHKHGNHYFDLGSGNGTYDAAENEKKFASYTPATRDTTNLYRYATKGVPHTTAGWRAWRFAVTEEDVGAWLAHCHILQHMIMGMQTTWVYGDRQAIMAKFPAQPYVHGYLLYGGDAYGNKSYDPLVDHPANEGKNTNQPSPPKAHPRTTTTKPAKVSKSTPNAGKGSKPGKPAAAKGGKGPQASRGKQ